MSSTIKQNLFSIMVILTPVVAAAAQMIAGRIGLADAAASALTGTFAAFVVWLRPSPMQQSSESVDEPKS